jgi:hypothetical protein
LLTPEIPATQEAEIWTFMRRLAKTNSLWDPFCKITRANHQVCRSEALSSNPSPIQKEKKKEEKYKQQGQVWWHTSVTGGRDEKMAVWHRHRQNIWKIMKSHRCGWSDRALLYQVWSSEFKHQHHQNKQKIK